ncbi:DUF6473 family protein [Thalassobius sp. S69A]|uniref:DUF6473 family protein n=1 Tax=Thalassobius sp. S69A TaxID=3450125 RepID=UPI0040562D18
MVGEMTYEHTGAGALDYLTCGYGQDRLHFRGPERSLDAPYGVFIGGTETYGKFIARPYPSLVEDWTGLTSVNLGVVNAGIETFRTDPTVLNIARGAEFAVLQVMGPQYVTNNFYAVHPRRNDRFIKVRPALTTMYPQLDFTEFHFVGHLLRKLRRTSPRAFEKIVRDCRKIWLTSLIGMVRRIDRPTFVVWMQKPKEEQRLDPFLDERLLEPVRKRCADVIAITPDDEAQEAGTKGMVFGQMEAFAAADLPNPKLHNQAALKIRNSLKSHGLV